MSMTSRGDAVARDEADTLAAFRGRFHVPEGMIYLDGNSLGPLPKATPERVRQVVEAEWGRDLITSWNKHRWIELPTRIGDKIARLIGAGPGEVVVADSTSINLFKLMAAAAAMRPGRRTILSQHGNFPTDLYIAQGLAQLLGDGYRLRLAEPDRIADAVDEDVALLFLTHVDYRSGRIHDMARVTKAAQAKGALMLWDLAHSAGALPVDLGGAGADLAVGCGYKYLNGGPGAPAFLYVAKRHHAEFRSPLSGWLGHAQPFAFEESFRPASGILRGVCGTPPVLSLAALEVGIDLALEADMAEVRAKSLALSETFMALIEQRCAGQGLRLASPAEPALRGSQASYAHPEGYAVMQALIQRGVIGDFRAPDLLRFGFTPLYTRFQDVWDAVEILHEIFASRAWDKAEFKVKAAVT